MCLRFVFLLITRVITWLRLSARGGVEDRRDFASAPPSHRPAASSGAPPEAELGGPGPARDPVRRDTESASPGAAAAGHPGHDPALAPRHRRAPLGGAVHARQVRPTGDPPEHPGSGPAAGLGEPRVGVPQDPRGAGQPGSQSRGVRPYGRSSRPTAPAPRRDGPGQPGRSSCVLRPRRSWRATSSRSTCSTAPRPTSWP